ncbi:YbcC family protein [Mangrovitalea sediminis]|uniref:YbcC family protein n=1 Tax=Mangrovitalea sediminis TaxID=1982043 RepID=UPI000BE6062B|nr:DUF2309 domain-containing protein [Mangrovitalea sediminis]
MKALHNACQRIAPAWPLDRLIAVNPWWPMIERPFEEVAAKLAALGGIRCLMPISHYRAQGIGDAVLVEAAAEAGVDAEQVRAADDLPAPAHWHSLAALYQRSNGLRWLDMVVDQISRCCALYWESDGCLYQHWLAHCRDEKGLALLMDCPTLPDLLGQLPESPERMLVMAREALGFDDTMAADLGHGWLLDINGWASAAAYLHWQAGQTGVTTNRLGELLAIRLAWEWITLQFAGPALLSRWQRQSLAMMIEAHREHQRLACVWQRAQEMAYQQELARELAVQPSPGESPRLQAVFCIDVRSEPMRRALEAQDPAIETRGFAGFFGLPIGYRPAGGDYRRPQLPGLLAPTLWVTEAAPAQQNQGVLERIGRWHRLTQASPATFGAVESAGLGYVFKLLRSSLWPSAPAPALNRRLRDYDGVFVLEDADGPLDNHRKAALVANILKAMELTRPAPLVLLVGHGSTSCNNPHAAGLDCGACGGQSGELNVRVLAQLVNDPAVRALLKQEQGIDLPDDCRFIAALHDTTSDELHCFSPVQETVQEWLVAASRQARAERAPRLGETDGESLRRRGFDGSQVRPEWGLADNACFIVAPRDRTRHLSFDGRSFLHDYRWEQDEGFARLEAILTAPMVVTHWINMQYNASVSDPEHYGSGNKILHNLVGAVGVLEGQGGDLRIGLPLQSVHDGENWRHRPQRLCVVVRAPADSLQAIVRRQPVVQQLVDNHWLTLLRLDEDGCLWRLYQGQYRAV